MSGIGADPFVLGDDPELPDILRVLAQSIRLQIRTHLPATIVAYDPAQQTASVLVGFRVVVRYSSPAALPPGATPLPVPHLGKAVLPPTQVNGIPVITHGTGTAYTSYPILPGATGTLHVHDRSLETWLLTGVPSDPVLAWTHALTSSEFHLGLHPKTAPIVPPTDLVATVVEGTQVKLGRLAVEPIPKGTTLFALIDTALAAASLAGAAVPGDGGKVAFDAFITAWNLGKAAALSVKASVE